MSILQSTERKPRLLLGVTGSIAAFKAPSIARGLMHAGFEVRAALSHSAQKVVTEAAFRAVLPDRPYCELWNHPGPEGGEVHIVWAEWADLIVIAPATATCLSDLRLGRYDNCVTLLAANLPPQRWCIAPAMSGQMWQQPAVQENVAALRDWGATFLGPVAGEVASGKSGQRLLEPRELSAAVAAVIERVGLKPAA